MTGTIYASGDRKFREASGDQENERLDICTLNAEMLKKGLVD